jgi:flagellum-specific ATP synthase
MSALAAFASSVSQHSAVSHRGRVKRIAEGTIEVAGLSRIARVGDLVSIARAGQAPLRGEIVSLGNGTVSAMAYASVEGLREHDEVVLDSNPDFRPDPSWLGKVIDAFGDTLDGAALAAGERAVPLRAPPPPATIRRRTGARLSTGLAVLDTVLPMVMGQRVGLFAGSGVGKSRLLARLAKNMEADIVIVGMIGERGREVREFVEETLGPDNMSRCCVIAATSDQPAAVKRRASWATLATAEYFRDQGKSVLLLFDSLTRFAEAHREIALTTGEDASLRGFPPSTAPMIASLAERAGPGPESGTGDITAVFTVLVAGSDMDEPVADMVRGVLDGHIVLDRGIAERGRYPAIDVRRSVSRSLPDAASEDENRMIAEARGVFGLYDKILPMIQVGLYREGGDAATDRAVALWPSLDKFVAEASDAPEAAFERLGAILAGKSPDEADQKPD